MKKYYRNYFEVSGSKYSTSIALVSDIIHDGIQNRSELVRKFAALTNRTDEVAEKCISQLELRDELGYYHKVKANGNVIDTFVIWDYKRAFEPTRAYKKSDYFDRWFRAKGGNKKNSELLKESVGFMYE